MIIVHDAALNILNTMAIHPEDHGAFLRREQPNILFIEHPKDVGHFDVVLERDEVGVVTVAGNRQRLAIVPPALFTVGEETWIDGVPEGVTITINGEDHGTMDASGTLEFTPDHAGAYQFTFSGRRWYAQRFEVLAL